MAAALTLTDGPLAGERHHVADWPYQTPPTVVWLARDARGRVVQLGPDKELLNLLAGEWMPYRTRQAAGEWIGEWDRWQDPGR